MLGWEGAWPSPTELSGHKAKAGKQEDCRVPVAGGLGGEAGRKEVSVAVAARAVAGAPVSLFLHFHTEEERRL